MTLSKTEKVAQQVCDRIIAAFDELRKIEREADGSR